MSKITHIFAREILDSRATPTVEVTVELDNNISATASCPSGASVGANEAVELRDGNKDRYNGLGVLKAVEHVNTTIVNRLVGQDPQRQIELDSVMCELDGTENKSKLGANAILPVSMAICKAAATSQNIHLYEYIRSLLSQPPTAYKPSLSAFNILNGGLHGGGNIDFQEFMIIPLEKDFRVALEHATRVYKALKHILKREELSALLGDEGGYSPHLASNTHAVDLLMEAIHLAGLEHYKDIALGIDVASSSFHENNTYKMREREDPFIRDELINLYVDIVKEYNLLYLEDPLAEEDFEGWSHLTSKLPETCIVTGDDLICTHPKRLQQGIDQKSIRGIIVKPNQIGTVSETLEVIEIAQKNNIKINVSHRSGETNDDFIADLAVAVNANFTKFGAPARGERVAKYNRLLKIAEELNG